MFGPIKNVIFDLEGTLIRSSNDETYAGVEELLGYLKAKSIFMAIYTSRDRAGTVSALEEKTWIPAYFDQTLLRCADDPCGRKPSPLPINDLCDKFNLNKSETIFVGDNLIDATAAQAAGVLFGAALWDLPGSDKQTFRSRYAEAWNKWNGVDMQFRLTGPLALKEYFETRDLAGAK